MSKIIAQFLNKTEDEVTKTVGRLEELAGFPAEDAKTVAENIQALRAKITQLGLDPDDTTGPELYQALRAKFKSDADSLDRALNAEGLDQSARIDKAYQVVGKIASSEVWALKAAAARKLLKLLPPKKSIKLMGYRSIDSMVKREDPLAIITAATVIEPRTWQKSFAAKVSKLPTSDFELRPIKFVKLNSKLSAAFTLHREAVSNHLTACLAVVPQASDNLSVLSMALVLAAELQKLEKIPTAAFAQIHPTLRFWQDAEHLLAWNNGEPISLNLKDICLDQLYGKGYSNRTAHHAAASFYEHLLTKYKQHIQELPEELDQVGYQAENALAEIKAPIRDVALDYSLVEAE